MSFIYLILGIIGWTATAIVLPMYVWFGFRKAEPRGFEITSDLKS
jgi:hypothetical protein